MIFNIVKFLKKPWMVLIVWQALFIGGLVIGSTQGLKGWGAAQFIFAAIWFVLFVFWALGMNKNLWSISKYK